MSIDRATFESISNSLDSFGYNSLTYTDYEDVKDGELLIRQENCLLIRSFNPNYKLDEFFWACNLAQELEGMLDKQEGTIFVSFIPEEWQPSLEKKGFAVHSIWHDFFIRNLKERASEFPKVQEEDFLCSDGELEQASEITVMCQGESRGFYSSEVSWFKSWLNEKDVSFPAFIGIKKDNKVLGFAATGVYGEPKTVWVRELAVDPKYQNRGIGRQILNKVLAYGIEHGAQKAFLAADYTNLGAVHLYESVGFVTKTDEGQINMLKM